MFEVEYPLNGWIKKVGVSTNLIFYDCLPLNIPIDFAFNSLLSLKDSAAYPVNRGGLFIVSAIENYR